MRTDISWYVDPQMDICYVARNGDELSFLDGYLALHELKTQAASDPILVQELDYLMDRVPLTDEEFNTAHYIITETDRIDGAREILDTRLQCPAIIPV